MDKPFYWESDHANAVMFDNDAFKICESLCPVVFDTGTTITLVPELVWERFLHQIQKKLPPWSDYKVNDDKSIMKMACDEVKHYPDVYLLVGGNWLQFAPEDYIFPSE